MSKCNRMKKALLLPAFDIKPIDDHTGTHGFDTPARSAAEAQAISEILPHICLGSWRDAEAAEVIKEKGITHVLNVAKECPSLKEQEAMDAVEVVKKSIPLVDAHSENILPHFEEAFMFIDEARASGGRVLVHCRRGISRSPAIVTGYIMHKTGLSYDVSLNFVTGCRSSVSLNLAFREVLYTYQPRCPKPDEEIGQLMKGAPRVILVNSHAVIPVLVQHEKGGGPAVVASTAVLGSGNVTALSSVDSSNGSGSTANSTLTNLGITPSEEHQSPDTTDSSKGKEGGMTFGGGDDENEEDDKPNSSGGKDSSSF